MQLNEILEENSIKSISQKTKISEENLENLLDRNFEALMKIKTLGFISIIEREYNADLNALREEALEYYASHTEDHAFSVAVPIEEEKKGTSKVFLIVVLALLGYATWYFFTQFDKKHLRELIPFKNQQMIENIIGEEDGGEKENLPVEDLSIENAVTNTTKAVTEETMEDNSVQETNQTDTLMSEEVNETAMPVSQF